MMTLAQLSVTVGVVIIAFGVPLVLVPGGTRRLHTAFPRNRMAGAILAAAALVWSAWEVNEMALGGIDAFKPLLWVIGPVLFALVVVYMDDLLAVRALGGLLMLVAGPMLDIQRFHPSHWRWVLAVLAYAWAIKGAVLILAPFRFRHGVEWAFKTDTACRGLGAAAAGFGMFLIGLGLTVF